MRGSTLFCMQVILRSFCTILRICVIQVGMSERETLRLNNGRGLFLLAGHATAVVQSIAPALGTTGKLGRSVCCSSW